MCHGNISTLNGLCGKFVGAILQADTAIISFRKVTCKLLVEIYINNVVIFLQWTTSLCGKF